MPIKFPRWVNGPTYCKTRTNTTQTSTRHGMVRVTTTLSTRYLPSMAEYKRQNRIPMDAR